MITVESVTVRYDGRSALVDVSFGVGAGETLAVMGANGAGKTTLLRLLAGLDDPDTGDIRRGGVVGFAPENPAAGLFADSVAGEVAFFPRNRGLDVDRHVTDAMRALSVEHLADRRPGSLSRGEQRRVSIAAVLAGDPAVVALDEPTAGLDRRAVDRLLAAMGRLDATVVVSTHDAEFAVRTADRVAILDDGTLDAIGPTGDLLADTDRLMAAGIRPPGGVEWAARNGIDDAPTGPREAAERLEATR